MSQRKAKEYRQAMRQYEGIANDVDDLKRRVGAMEARNRLENPQTDLAYRCLKDLQREQQRRQETVWQSIRECKRNLWGIVIVFGILCILIIVSGIMNHLREADADGLDAASNTAIMVTSKADSEAALLASGYYSEAVPMPYEYQSYMREYCRAYGCPYPLALAVAETESHFDMAAVGGVGEIGIMQLNPGPDGTYHDALEQVTGLDPDTPEGNIAAGCYLLGKYLAEYGNHDQAAMAYSMGHTGAERALAEGIRSTQYTDAVLAAEARWECAVNPWDGE